MTSLSPTGFRLHYFRDLQELRPLAMDASVPRSRQERCPACGGSLGTLATLIAAEDRDRLSLGYCRACGYRGYRDRPTKEWLGRFYSEEWDNARIRDAKKEARRAQPWLSGVQKESVHLAARLAPSPARPVCEIGCGMGSALKEFETLGFSNIIGVEHSRFRSEVTANAYGYKVLTGAFESDEVLRALQAYAPIGTLYSFHALEHVYDPSALLTAASKLQNEGDIFVIAVPKAEDEAKVMTLFWLPHLHAFTRTALRRLFERHGYEIAEEAAIHPSHLVIAARRTSRQIGSSAAGGVSGREESISDYFRLSSLVPGKRYRFSWKKKTYRTALRPVPSSRSSDRLLQALERVRNFFAAHLFRKFYSSRSLVMSAIERRYTTMDESPFEVQYDGPIELLIR